MSQSPNVPVSTAQVESGASAPPALLGGPLLGRSSQRERRGVTAVATGIWGLITLNRKVMSGFAIVGFFTLVALLGPLFIHQNPQCIGSFHGGDLFRVSAENHSCLEPPGQTQQFHHLPS